jgi:hypothetical protein
MRIGVWPCLKVCFSKSYPGTNSSSTFLETYFADCMQADTDGHLQLLTIIRLTTGRIIVLNTREPGVAGNSTKEGPGRNFSKCPSTHFELSSSVIL